MDALLRRPGEYPEPEGWPAVEAVLVGLAGLEAPLVRPGGVLEGFEPELLHDPRHRALWRGFELQRRRPELSLGAALALVAPDVPNHVGLESYVVALWAEYPSSLGVNLARARQVLEERAEAELELERVTEKARARGVLPRLRVSEFAVRDEPPNSDSTPGEQELRHQGAARASLECAGTAAESPTAVEPLAAPRAAPLEAGLSAARVAPAEPCSSGDRLSWCPSPVNKVYVDHYRGVMSTVDVPCLKRACPWCGPRWVDLHVQSVSVPLTDRDAWVVTVPRSEWDTFRKRQERAHSEWDYKRIPLPDGEAALVITIAKVEGATRVPAAELRDVLEPALADIRNVKGAKVSASTEWSVAAYRRAHEQETAPSLEVEYLGDVAATLEKVERVLGWWPNVKARQVTAAGRTRLYATGVTPDVTDALLRNGLVRHPAARALERKARTSRSRPIDAAALEQYEREYLEWSAHVAV